MRGRGGSSSRHRCYFDGPRRRGRSIGSTAGDNDRRFLRSSPSSSPHSSSPSPSPPAPPRLAAPPSLPPSHICLDLQLQSISLSLSLSSIEHPALSLPCSPSLFLPPPSLPLRSSSFDLSLALSLKKKNRKEATPSHLDTLCLPPPLHLISSHIFLSGFTFSPSLHPTIPQPHLPRFPPPRCGPFSPVASSRRRLCFVPRLRHRWLRCRCACLHRPASSDGREAFPSLTLR